MIVFMGGIDLDFLLLIYKHGPKMERELDYETFFFFQTLESLYSFY